jgi:hypothetical protein
MTRETASKATSADFDLHGYVGIRLLDALPDDIARVERQLGPLRVQLAREPDITVRFVDRLNGHGRLTYVTFPDAGFDESGFYVLRGRGNVRGKTFIPFQHVGTHCQIVCERRLPAVPLLLAIVNLTALAKGLLPLHASAFNYEGKGVLATGWAKGGKTETLLSFMNRGAQYVGDEWVYVTPHRQMFGIPEPIRLWRWQLKQLPQYSARLRRKEAIRLAAVDAVARVVERANPRDGSSGFVRSLLRRAGPVIRRQVNVQLPPARLFGEGSIGLRGRMDHVLFVASHEAPDFRVEHVDASDVASRMAHSLAEERLEFMSYYRQFCFAFPDRRSAVVERAIETEGDLLERCLVDVPAVWLRHPYPVEIARIYQSIADLL